MIRDHKADVNARDDQNNMPIHVAAFCGKEKVVLALIKEFGCDPTVRGHLDRSLLNLACITGKAKVVKALGSIISPLVVDYCGDTPLHVCSSRDHSECVEALLLVNAPLLVRNKKGYSVIDVSQGKAIQEYMRVNKNKIHIDYNIIQKNAKKRYSSAEHITRIFVIGNSGSGKSSLIETLKREGFFDSFWRVSSPLYLLTLLV